MKKDYTIKRDRLLNKLNNFTKKHNCTIDELLLEDIDTFILNNMKTINRSAYYTNIKALNEILKDNKSDIKVNSNKYVNECVKAKDEQYFTRREIQDVCNSLLNLQDRFIIYALWNGIMGKQYSDLLNIKVSDVSEDYSYIMVNSKKFICDDYMKEIVIGTIKKKTYYKILHSYNARISDKYDFNPDSQYLIKTKPTKNNNNGLNPMGFQGVQRKLTKLQNLYEEEHCEKIILNGLTLVKSGIMFDMFIQAIENGKVWNIESINDYIKMNGHKINANELYRVYWQRYYDSFVAIY